MPEKADLCFPQACLIILGPKKAVPDRQSIKSQNFEEGKIQIFK